MDDELPHDGARFRCGDDCGVGKCCEQCGDPLSMHVCEGCGEIADCGEEYCEDCYLNPINESESDDG